MEENYTEVRRLNREIQRRIRKHKEKYINKKCITLENYFKHGEIRERTEIHGNRQKQTEKENIQV